jgi:hypothetical protein
MNIIFGFMSTKICIKKQLSGLNFGINNSTDTQYLQS